MFNEEIRAGFKENNKFNRIIVLGMAKILYE